MRDLEQMSNDSPVEQPLLGEDGEPFTGVTPFDNDGDREQLERALVKKVDNRMSILVLIYILNYIDRNNAAAARLRGFQTDLGLSDTQFSSVLSILYVGYFMMQVPSNMYLNHAGKPSVYLPICMVIWGGISMATGLVTDYVGALCARFLLGFVEAAFYPGALFLISRWYKRSELSTRLAYLSCGSLLSNAFGALIASGILDVMDGVFGFTAWRWLFFVEGGVTVIVALCAIFILPDFPETTVGWLTPAEQALAVQRMAEDSNSGMAKSQATDACSGLSLALHDYKVYWLACGLTIFVVSLSFHVYFPTLAATMGFSPTISLLLCAPPWLSATIVVLAVTRRSDRQGKRCDFIVASLCVGIIGFAISALTLNIFFRYMALFLMTSSYAGFICMLAWASSSLSQPPSPAKLSVALAIVNCVSQLGNIGGAYTWPSTWGPSYRGSYMICILASVTTIGFSLQFRRHLVSLNTREEVKEKRLGLRPGYRYML